MKQLSADLVVITVMIIIPTCAIAAIKDII